MKCPFCGEEMREGALQANSTQRDMRDGWYYRWVPPLPAEEPEEQEAPRPQGRGLTLEAVLGTAREKLGELQKKPCWDLDAAVCLEPDEEERGLKELLFTGGVFYRNAWYCPKCEKALCVFSRDEGREAWMARPETPEEGWTPPGQKPEKPAPPPTPDPAPPPRRRPKPQDDPWEQKGLFGRRKKPDWEK